ncbi:SDR family NAD(P)-dependent oxidoreductase [Mariniradius sediminis]|uniref:SDR family NAD(P)-dependent oxidoreductase n=1 Tax=Mariniradius sediminis TaxID=2909237 RepID=A0ABS9BW05_9BACT|nr:SDR family NAD(P)-dependent oxidoreductase [Mariniradius sediminis]MCF1751912.1 SDR family NAD(P)-dependent oxidoreductase [Mariniradius sediminis]
MRSEQLYIITGSSKGIGLGLVKHLIQNPCIRVIGISRTKTAIEHPNFTEIACDLSDLNSIPAILDRIFPAGTFSRIVLVNNAGTLGEIGYVGALSSKNIAEIFSINTIAPAILMNAFVSKYASYRHAERVIINISSGAATKAIDGWAMYSASKAAINSMSQTAQKEAELKETGVRVFALAPGVVDTDMQKTIRQSEEESFSQLKRFRKLKEDNALSTSTEVAEKILYLLDNMADFPEVIQDVRNF